MHESQRMSQHKHSKSSCQRLLVWASGTAVLLLTACASAPPGATTGQASSLGGQALQGEPSARASLAVLVSPDANVYRLSGRADGFAGSACSMTHDIGSSLVRTTVAAFSPMFSITAVTSRPEIAGRFDYVLSIEPLEVRWRAASLTGNYGAVKLRVIVRRGPATIFEETEFAEFLHTADQTISGCESAGRVTRVAIAKSLEADIVSASRKLKKRGLAVDSNPPPVREELLRLVSADRGSDAVASSLLMGLPITGDWSGIANSPDFRGVIASTLNGSITTRPADAGAILPREPVAPALTADVSRCGRFEAGKGGVGYIRNACLGTKVVILYCYVLPPNAFATTATARYLDCKNGLANAGETEPLIGEARESVMLVPGARVVLRACTFDGRGSVRATCLQQDDPSAVVQPAAIQQPVRSTSAIDVSPSLAPSPPSQREPDEDEDSERNPLIEAFTAAARAKAGGKTLDQQFDAARQQQRQKDAEQRRRLQEEANRREADGERQRRQIEEQRRLNEARQQEAARKQSQGSSTSGTTSAQSSPGKRPPCGYFEDGTPFWCTK